MEKAELTVKSVFESLGGRPAVTLLFKQCGFKPYSALLYNWEEANAIPPAWWAALTVVIKRFGKTFPALADLEMFVRKGGKRPGFENRHDYSHNPLYMHIKNVYGSVNSFIRAMKLDHALKLQRKQVYEWFAANAVTDRLAWAFMIQAGAPRDIVGPDPRPVGKSPTIKAPYTKSVKQMAEEFVPAPEDLF